MVKTTHKPNRTYMFDRGSQHPSPLHSGSSRGPVIWTHSSWCCLGSAKRCGVGTVGDACDPSEAKWEADTSPRTAEQIDVITAAAHSDMLSLKCSIAANNKKIKATSVGFSFNRSLANRSECQPLEIYNCTDFCWKIFPRWSALVAWLTNQTCIAERFVAWSL